MKYYNRIKIILASDVKEDEADSALMTEADKFKKFGPVVKTFKSSSNPNKSYEVRRLKGQDPTCNCLGWANRRKCKHTDDVIRNKIAATAAIEVSPVNRPKKEEDSVRDILDRYQKKQAKATAATAEKALVYIKQIEAKKWSGDVKTKWTPKEGFFNESADKIASGLKRASKDLKQAMSRLNFFINRAGDKLAAADKKRLENAKDKLRKLYA